ncbi:MAG: serine/threonine protein kinase [Verrucomicrobia bacterium]|nr:serine/threonine protein kinase [Verrucomicrobiota bacterium]
MVTCSSCGSRVFIPDNLQPLSTYPCSKCGHNFMVPMRLRQFELREIIGQGGMGTVFRSFDVMLEREVAVKLMKPELANDKEAITSFLREAKAAAGLNHSNIIHIYSFDESEGSRYLVMELANNGSLDSWIESGQIVPELNVLDIGIKIASALDCANKHGLLHRDVKPANILFNNEGEPKLVDFGLAIQGDDTEVGESVIWGTPYYIAPEKIRREREDFLADMYSLAGTLYHALTGRVPFDAPTVEEVVMAHVESPLVPPNQIISSITEMTSQVIVRAMAKDPNERYQSYDEFIMAMTAARSQLLIQTYRSNDSEEEKKGWW